MKLKNLVAGFDRTYRLRALVFFVLAQACALDQVAASPGSAACAAISSNLLSANRAALALFQQRVVKRSDVGAAPRIRPRGFDPAEAIGAIGDGSADDTQALQGALAQGRRIWLKSMHVYRITRRLELGSGSALASDGSATVLMSSGVEGFDNTVAQRSEAGLYSTRGTGLRVEGQNITISDLFLVKQYADGRYVIGVDVVESSDVKIQRVRLRGFSLAPGIVTIRSSDRVQVVSSLIHASCTQSVDVPPDVASFQITGISVDDTRVSGRGSTALRLHNNVIADLRMLPLTTRGDQSDGITFAAIGTGAGSVIEGNDIRGVDEGIDLFGSGIEVRRNRVAAHSLTFKLVHGARAIVAMDNEFTPGPNGRAIGMFRANPPEPRRQVQDIRIERNRINLSSSQRPGVVVDATGGYVPADISLRNNLFVVSKCGQEAVACSSAQCSMHLNRKVRSIRGSACKD